MLVCCVATYTLGSFDTDFSQQHLENLTDFVEKQITYVGMTADWTMDSELLENYRTALENIHTFGAIPLIEWNPCPPIFLADSMYATSKGLNDHFISAFLEIVKEFEQNYSAQVILVVGSNANENEKFSENIDLFKVVYERIKGIAIELKLSSKFAIGLSSAACKSPEVAIEKCEDGWFVGEDGMLEQCEVDPEPPELVVNETQNDYQKTVCEKSIADLYPGDTYVDFIVVSAMNDVREEWRESPDLVHKAMFVAEQASHLRPVIIMSGSKSVEGSYAEKNEFLQRLVQTIDFYDENHQYYRNNVAGLVLYNKESSLDTAFYNSLHGDVETMTTGNGVKLYGYSGLEELNSNDRIATEVSLDAALSGAICSPGYRGALTGVCAECPAGTFQNRSGQSECLNCPIGYFNEDTGKTECDLCPESSTTENDGAARLEYCVCVENHEMINDICEKCPKNEFSRLGGECIECPSGNRYGSRGKAGIGCFCKTGYKWSSAVAECISDATSSSKFIFGLCAALVSTLIM